MPNCFQLLRDGVAEDLIKIDEELCRHFGADCHPTRYYQGWYDVIGYDLAKGHSFAQIKSYLTASGYENASALVQIAEWLESCFTVRSWVEIGRQR